MNNYQETLNQNFNQPQATRLSFDTITQTFGNHADRLDNVLRAKLASMDPNNTSDMLEFQVEYNKYLVVENLRASVIKAMKDALQGIIQKF
jgi:type III secretion protein F